MSHTRVVPLALAGALLAGACSPGAADTPTEATGAGSDPGEPPTDDPRDAVLADQVATLRTTVAAARDLLAAAAADGDHDAAASAVAALTADEGLRAGASADVPPLLPGPETSREETIDYGDALTATYTAARTAGGSYGADVSRVLADQVAGDLGAWQRGAEGILEAVDDAASGGTVEDAEPAVLGLVGEGPRALAWALLAARAQDPATVTAAAERGVAHLELVLAAVDALTEDT